VPKLSINFEEILSRGHEEQNKVLGFPIIINYRISMTEVFPCFSLSCKANARV
jgi:hypothetical protein